MSVVSSPYPSPDRWPARWELEEGWVEKLSCTRLSDSEKATRKNYARDLAKAAVTALSLPNPRANSDSFQFSRSMHIAILES